MILRAKVTLFPLKPSSRDIYTSFMFSMLVKSHILHPLSIIRERLFHPSTQNAFYTQFRNCSYHTHCPLQLYWINEWLFHNATTRLGVKSHMFNMTIICFKYWTVHVFEIFVYIMQIMMWLECSQSKPRQYANKKLSTVACPTVSKQQPVESYSDTTTNKEQ